jgi:hypothetical protein
MTRALILLPWRVAASWLMLVFGSVAAAAEPPGIVNTIPLAEQRVIDWRPFAAEEIERRRQVLVSPTVNAPEAFQGYGGHNGWVELVRLQNGDLLCVFVAGYAHGSSPTPLDIHPAEKKADYSWALADRDWDCPTGGQVMMMRSGDQGQTWSRPKPLLASPPRFPLRHVCIRQLRDGSLLCLTWPEAGLGHFNHLPTGAEAFARACMNRFPPRQYTLRSIDGGETWQEWGVVHPPLLGGFYPQKLVELPDGALRLFGYGCPLPIAPGWPKQEGQVTPQHVSLVLGSDDQGRTWRSLSVVGLPDLMDVCEPQGVLLPDGRLGVLTRPTSAWFTSSDDGVTWSGPRRLQEGFGWGREGEDANAQANKNSYLYTKGDVVVTPDGVVVAVFTNLQSRGNGLVIYSRDNGRTWITPAANAGFQVNPWAYYPSACVLADGSILVAGHMEWYTQKGCPFDNPYGGQTGVITAVRFRVKSPAEGEGVELLPP